MEFFLKSPGFMFNHRFKRNLAGGAVIAFAGMALVGCGNSKVAQCNELIEIANQAATEVEAVTQSASPEDTEAFLRIADTADQAAGNLEAIDLSDEQLQGYKQRFITLYVETSQATRALIEAVEQQNPTGAEEAYSQLEAATGEEGPLVDEVNQYCGGAAPE